MTIKAVFFALMMVGVASVGAARAKDAAQAKDASRKQYEQALYESTLEWLNSQPFELRFDFQLYDLNGKPAETGHSGEVWGNVADPKVFVNAPSLKVPTVDAEKTNRREAFLVGQMRRAIVRPFAHVAPSAGFSWKSVQPSNASPGLTCWSALPADSTDSSVAYCLDSDRHLAEVVSSLCTIQRTNFRKFGQHEVPTDVKISYAGRISIIAHVTEVDRLQPIETPAKPATTSPADTTVASQVMAGSIVRKKNPDYPKEARKRHITGSVLLTAIIDKDGEVTQLEAIASPDELLTKSALDAVKTWRYKPYLLNGVPTEVDTTITVNYSFN